MKNAKRLAALFLTAAVLLTAGCSRKTVTSQSSVWFIAKSTNTEFWKSAFAGANAAKSEYNVDLTICGPETEEDYEEQNRLIDEASPPVQMPSSIPPSATRKTPRQSPARPSRA